MSETNLLPLTGDLIFKMFFKDENNRSLLISLLSTFLPLPKGSTIISVEVLDSEMLPDKASKRKEGTGKKYILDLKVAFKRTDSKGDSQVEIANVECQTTNHPYITDRLLAYAGRLYGNQLKEGDVYQKLQRVYSLIFTTANLTEFLDSPRFDHTCTIREEEPPYSVFSKGICFTVIELGKFNRTLNENLDIKALWCYLLKNADKLAKKEQKRLAAKGEVMAKALEKLWNLSKDELAQELHMAEIKRDMDRRSSDLYIREKERAEGRAEGRVEGRAEGRERRDE